MAQAIELFGGRRWNLSTGGTEKAAHQKNSPLSINDKTKKKKKVLVRVSRLYTNSNNLIITNETDVYIKKNKISSTQGDSGDATDDEMVSRKTRSCKEGLYRNGPESDSIDQEDPGL